MTVEPSNKETMQNEQSSLRRGLKRAEYATSDMEPSHDNKLLILLQVELAADFVIVDQQKRHSEAPTLAEFLFANPDQKPMP
ncbi:hypothetical protein EV561_104407 [Rhizobium sp. BK376]|nr:hypothetical protein EV561_104407 [Rhizobium sp. BK376]